MRCPIVACILAGGEGTRLLPLTYSLHCAKPAVRFGGSYRLIDPTLSNCVNSDVLFCCAVLREVLGEDAQRRSTHDFGREILPGMLGRYRVAAFPFAEGSDKAPAYWRDMGTIDAYWEAYMDLVGPRARVQLSQPHWPLRATQAQAPSTTIVAPGGRGAGQGGWVTHTLIAPGGRLQGGRVDRAILSPDVWIEAEAEVQESILFDGVHIGGTGAPRHS